MKIQAICYDADGVMVNPQLQFSKLLKSTYGITPQKTREFFNGIFNECLTGGEDLAAVLPPFLVDWGWRGTVKEFIDLWLATDHVIDRQLMDHAQSLRRAGILCCLTTCQEHHRAAYMKSNMGFQNAFDALFFSCEIGCQKSDPAFFEHVERTLGLDRRSILLWDDSPVNIETARKFGLNAEIYTGYADYREQLKKVYRFIN